MEDPVNTLNQSKWDARPRTSVMMDPSILNNPSASYILPVPSIHKNPPSRQLTSIQPSTPLKTPLEPVAEQPTQSACTKFWHEHFSLTRLMGFLLGLIITGVPLAVLLTLFIQLSTTTTTMNTASTTASYNLPNQCSSSVYGPLNDATRLISYSAGCCTSDCSVSPGWYRISGAGGTQLATSPVSVGFCNANYPGWFNGTLPSVVGATTFGSGCVNYAGAICHPSYSSNFVLATNCGSFYVFYLTTMSSCSWSRYCTTF